MTVNVPCSRALAVAARWQTGALLHTFACSATAHSFDQVVVECEKRPSRRRRRRGPERRIAFVFRDPDPAPAVARRSAGPEAAAGALEPPEPLAPDDALPRGEES